MVFTLEIRDFPDTFMDIGTKGNSVNGVDRRFANILRCKCVRCSGYSSCPNLNFIMKVRSSALVTTETC